MDGREARAVLGVSENVTATEIKRAYRALVLRAHPDRGGRRGEFERIHSAFQLLISLAPAERKVRERRPTPFDGATVPKSTWVRDEGVRRFAPQPVRFEDVLRQAIADLDAA